MTINDEIRQQEEQLANARRTLDLESLPGAGDVVRLAAVTNPGTFPAG